MKKIFLAIALTCLFVSCDDIYTSIDEISNYDAYFNIDIINNSDKDIAVKMSTECGDVTRICYGEDKKANINFHAPKKVDWRVENNGNPIVLDPESVLMRVYEYTFYVLDDTTSIRVIYHHGGDAFIGGSQYMNGVTLSTADVGDDSSYVNWIVQYSNEGIYYPNNNEGTQPKKDYIMLEEFADYYEQKANK